jgi:hypothetical protein
MYAPKRNATSGPPKSIPIWSISGVLVAEVLRTRSRSLAHPDDGISEPSVLRRSDGSSVYMVARSELFTSARILEAEQRLVAAAGRTDGWVVEAATV